MAGSDTLQPLRLLLLPRPAENPTLEILRVAYGPGLTQALTDVSNSSNRSTSVTLDIAIAYDYLDLHYSQIQELLGLTYRLVCTICTEQSIDIQYDNDVDVRVTLFDTDRERSSAQVNTKDIKSQQRNCIIDLRSLAEIDRLYTHVYSLESEPGEELLQDYLRLRSGSSQPKHDFILQRIPGGLSVRHQNSANDMRPIVSGGGFNHHHSVAVGGTFDHLHAGHKLLLTMTALVLQPDSSSDNTTERCLTIGITGDELLKKKQYIDEVEHWDTRQSTVQCFLLGILQLMSPANVLKRSQEIPSSEKQGREVHNLLESGIRIRYAEIFDPCGPTITDSAISALVISAETRAGGTAVNEKRQEMGWSALEIFEVDVLNAGEDVDHDMDGFQSKISSTDIRSRIHQKRQVAADGKA